MAWCSRKTHSKSAADARTESIRAAVSAFILAIDGAEGPELTAPRPRARQFLAARMGWQYRPTHRHRAKSRRTGEPAMTANEEVVSVIGWRSRLHPYGVAAPMTTEARKKKFRFDLSRTVEPMGRVARALAAGLMVIRKTGRLLRLAEWAPVEAYPC